jgi:hypothetical protein
MSVRKRRFRPLVLVGLALAVVATACGGGSAKGSTPVAAAAATTTSTDPANAYTACLRQHGADVPDRPARSSTTVAGGTTGPSTSRTPRSLPAGGTRPSTTLPPGVDANALAAARQACASLMPTGPNGGGFGGGANGQAFQAYASCLKDHGVTVPDTTATTGGTGGGGNGGGNGGLGNINRDDPTFKAADAICAPLRPTPSSTPSTTVKP